MIRPLLIAATALSVSACALLSSPDPVQMYRFGVQPAAPVATASSGTSVDVAVRRITFAEAAEGDRILTVNGTEAAYLAGARWMEPAPDLFASALESAVATRSGRVRLIGARDLAQGDMALDVDVPTFETRYGAPEAPPVVAITARVRLIALPSREIVAERTFTVQEPTSENRVGPIVQAYDRGVVTLAGDVAGWLEQTAGR